MKYSEDSMYDRTLDYGTDTVQQIVRTFESAPKDKYDREQGLFVILSQLIYVLKHRWGLSTQILNEAIDDGLKADE